MGEDASVERRSLSISYRALSTFGRHSSYRRAEHYDAVLAAETGRLLTAGKRVGNYTDIISTCGCWCAVTHISMGGKVNRWLLHR